MIPTLRPRALMPLALKVEASTAVLKRQERCIAQPHVHCAPSHLLSRVAALQVYFSQAFAQCQTKVMS